ncbi:MAG TPA: hypothetical protein VMV69_28010 [Pirellulales bacterium]|nr:hypothetical protein [Pirellulales bacterium]
MAGHGLNRPAARFSRVDQAIEFVIFERAPRVPLCAVRRRVANPGERVMLSTPLPYEPAQERAEPPPVALAGLRGAAALPQCVEAGQNLRMRHGGGRGELAFLENPAGMAAHFPDMLGAPAVAGQVRAVIGQVFGQRAARVLFLFARRGQPQAFLVGMRLPVLQLAFAGGLVGEQRDAFFEAVGAGELAVPFFGKPHAPDLARSLARPLGFAARELAVRIVEAGHDLAGELVPVGLAANLLALGVEMADGRNAENGHAGSSIEHAARRGAGLYSRGPHRDGEGFVQFNVDDRRRNSSRRNSGRPRGALVGAQQRELP